MAFDLYSFEYLKTGSARQQRAYESLAELNPLRRLDVDENDGLGLRPALVGSVPLDLGLDESELVIATFSSNLKSYSQFLASEFGTHDGFESARGIELGVATLVTSFRLLYERYRIFTQNIPVARQSSVILLMIEERLLLLGGESFREKVWQAKLNGRKTEPAFGEILGLENPYRELLDLEDLSDDELRERFRSCF